MNSSTRHLRLLCAPLLGALLLPLVHFTGRSLTLPTGDAEETMNAIAESYVHLVLALGRHDPDYVDAYYGPEEWAAASRGELRPLRQIEHSALDLIHRLTAIVVMPEVDTLLSLRHEYLKQQLQSLVARTQMLQGRHFSFDEESAALYNAVSPTFTAGHYDSLLQELDAMLPGQGSLQERYEQFRKGFVIPRQPLDTVFTTAINECRTRTRRHCALPAGESFTVEYVNNKPWTGYNWYKGNAHSLIQVNTDQPLYIDYALHLAAHEGYPGHHVYNTLMEEHLVRERGWMEFSVYALFSPQSLIAEGTANFGVDVVFPDREKIAFERDVLFPLAHIDSANASRYYTIQEWIKKLSYAGNEAARQYLDGKMSREDAIQWLVRYSLATRSRAEQRIAFIEKYRSYVINYNLGEDLVRGYVERQGGTNDHPDKRWTIFVRLLSTPRLPSGLH
jgi:hypothetical protein